MDLNDLHPADDYSHRFFIWHEWIQANGPLTAQNAFEYFATSMFYEKQSNNAVLRMQSQHTIMTPDQEMEQLRRFTGIEFALVHAEAPTLFIIHKRERLTPDEVRPLAAYFIMNNRIYQSPDVYTVVSNRLLTALHSLQSSLDTLRKHRPTYTPRTGFIWPIVDKESEESRKKTDDALAANASDTLPPPSQAPPESQPDASSRPDKTTTATGRKTQNNFLMWNAMRTTAMHANASFAAQADPAPQAGAPRASVPPSKAQTPARSSATPARGITPAQVAPPVVAAAPKTEPVKGIPGQGKKKRKRTLPAQPTSTSS